MKNFKIVLIACLLGCVHLATAKEVLFSNPVMPGDFPDPSVVRVGDDFWATATSSEWGPLFPILHSRDLVNWELKGTMFDKKPAWSSRNYWAPEIFHHKGKFYVYYVGRKDETNGVLHVAVATAHNPEGPWTDHGPMIGQPDGSIDGMAFATEKDELYLLWKNDGNSRKQPTIIWAQKLSSDGTRLVGEMKELLRNDQAWEGSLIEGPFVHKRGEWFYIFYAGNGCCGKGCTYGVGVARSKNLLGPYEKDPANPIVIANEKWKCPGHGSIVSTKDGRDFFLYHAYDTQDFVYVGRQGVLDEIKWKPDGWPLINEGKGTSISAVSPFGKAQFQEPEFADDFTAGKLGVRWQWPHSLEPHSQLKDGKLVLSSASDRGTDLFGSVVAVQTTAGNYAATVLLEASALTPGAKAGLFAFGDSHNAIGIALGKDKVELVRSQRGKQEILATLPAPALAKAYLRMEATGGHRLRFFIWEGTAWKSIADADLNGDYLPPWDRGVRVALTVGGAPAAAAQFEWLRIVPKGLPREMAD